MQHCGLRILDFRLGKILRRWRVPVAVLALLVLAVSAIGAPSSSGLSVSRATTIAKQEAAKAAASAVAGVQGEVLRISARGVVTKHTPAANTDLARGAALAEAAAAAAVAGDTIRLSANTYQLAAPLVLAEGVLLRGDATFTGAYGYTGTLALKGTTWTVGATDCDYATTQAAVTAAEAACSAAVRITILVSKNTSIAYTLATASNARWIRVQAVGLPKGPPDTLLPSNASEQRHVAPYYVRGPALLCIKSDDGMAGWLTLSATLGNVTPAEYCRRRNIPITLALPAAKWDGVDTAGRLTRAQIVELNRASGFEICAHGYYHDEDLFDETSRSAQIQETVGAKYAIENMVNPAAPTVPSGLVCNGWIVPGGADYISLWGTASAMAGDSGAMLRDNFDWSMGYIDYSSRTTQAMTAMRYGWRYAQVVNASTSDAAQKTLIDGYLREAARTGGRTVFSIHTLVESGGSGIGQLNMDVFKYLIDQLTTTYANLIECVTLSTIYNGIMPPPVYVGGVLQNTKPFGWDFERFVTGDLVDNAAPEGMHFESIRPETTCEVAAPGGTPIDHGYPDTKCLHFYKTGASSYDRIYFYWVPERPGETRTFNFDLKKSEVAEFTGPGQVNANVAFAGATGGYEGAIQILPLTDAPDDWTTIKCTVSCPSWTKIAQIQFFFAATLAGEKKGIMIDNVEMRQK